MNEPRPTDLPEHDLTAEMLDSLAVCPYVGLQDDANTHSISHQVENYCHRRGHPRAIRSDYLDRVCLSGAYRDCNIYTQRAEDQPPTAVQEPGVKAQPFRSRSLLHRAQWARLWRRRRSWLIVTLVCLALLLALAALAFILIRSGGAAQAASGRQPGPVMQTTASLTGDELAGGPQATATPEAALAAIDPPGEAATPLPADPTRSSTSTAANGKASLTPTVGPLAETPFGRAPVGDGPMLVHVANPGESWDLLAHKYDTTVAVLQATNPRNGQQSVWEGEPLVILPGLKETIGLTPLKAKWIDGHWEIESA